MIESETPSVEKILGQGYIWTFDGRSPEPERRAVHHSERCGGDPDEEAESSQTEETLRDEDGNFVADMSLFGFRWHDDEAEASKLAAKLFLKKSSDILRDLNSARKAARAAVTGLKSKLLTLRVRVASRGAEPESAAPSVEEVLRQGCVFEHYRGLVIRHSVDFICIKKRWRHGKGVVEEDAELWSDDDCDDGCLEPIALLRDLGSSDSSLFLSKKEALRARDAWLLASAEEALTERREALKDILSHIADVKAEISEAKKILERMK